MTDAETTNLSCAYLARWSAQLCAAHDPEPWPGRDPFLTTLARMVGPAAFGRDPRLSIESMRAIAEEQSPRGETTRQFHRRAWMLRSAVHDRLPGDGYGAGALGSTAGVALVRADMIVAGFALGVVDAAALDGGFAPFARVLTLPLCPAVDPLLEVGSVVFPASAPWWRTLRETAPSTLPPEELHRTIVPAVQAGTHAAYCPAPRVDELTLDAWPVDAFRAAVTLRAETRQRCGRVPTRFLVPDLCDLARVLGDRRREWAEREGRVGAALGVPGYVFEEVGCLTLAGVLVFEAPERVAPGTLVAVVETPCGAEGPVLDDGGKAHG